MSEQAKHTPGLWHFDVPDNWFGMAARIYHDRSDKIGTVDLKGWGKRIGLANARIIAAAPELLEACQLQQDIDWTNEALRIPKDQRNAQTIGVIDGLWGKWESRVREILRPTDDVGVMDDIYALEDTEGVSIGHFERAQRMLMAAAIASATASQGDGR